MTIVNKAYVVAQFNSIVRTFPDSGAAPWYSGVGGLPASISSHPTLGPRAEPSMAVTDLPTPPAYPELATTVFNMLHNFAQKLTRVRMAHYVYFSNSGAAFTPAVTNVGPVLTALQEDLALHFDIPSQPNPGDLVDDNVLNTFLGNLRTAVAQRRYSTHVHTMYACHTSCHNSCHGSRGRR